ncbi:MAG: dicarboxylate/amino acid:cation symporter, partial [Candidatus Omnitrophica bacterium]|nr:dicarboxylate/amino acid:cation symporter [Candidatus Omnitrophota bacterium]
PLGRFFKNMQPALLTALSTSSSSATLPVSFECIEKKEGISKEVAGFVLPVGATVNMDGTAIYEAVACLFIAQAMGIELSLSAQVVVFFTAALAAIGAAAIPSAGLITLAIVLTAVNLPLEGIGFLLAFDRPLDMCRTVVNVWGDLVGCAILEEQAGPKGSPQKKEIHR